MAWKCARERTKPKRQLSNSAILAAYKLIGAAHAEMHNRYALLLDEYRYSTAKNRLAANVGASRRPHSRMVRGIALVLKIVKTTVSGYPVLKRFFLTRKIQDVSWLKLTHLVSCEILQANFSIHIS